ncbi:MAG: M48 family metallopeptidase [Mycoplasma sp.]
MRSITYPYKFITKYIDKVPYTFKVYFSNNKHSRFKLDENNEVILLLANGLDENSWDYFFEKQLQYYVQLSNLKNNKGLVNEKTSFVKVFNQKYLIKLMPSKSKRNYFEVIDKKIYLHLVNENKKIEVINQAIVNIASNYLNKRCNYWAKKMQVPLKKIIFKELETCFAYFKPKESSITFSIMSLSFELETIDYLIIHELAHHYYQNHSKLFWFKVKEFCPNYKEFDNKLRNWL